MSGIICSWETHHSDVFKALMLHVFLTLRYTCWLFCAKNKPSLVCGKEGRQRKQDHFWLPKEAGSAAAGSLGHLQYIWQENTSWLWRERVNLTTWDRGCGLTLWNWLILMERHKVEEEQYCSVRDSLLEKREDLGGTELDSWIIKSL